MFLLWRCRVKHYIAWHVKCPSNTNSTFYYSLSSLSLFDLHFNYSQCEKTEIKPKILRQIWFPEDIANANREHLNIKLQALGRWSWNYFFYTIILLLEGIEYCIRTGYSTHFKENCWLFVYKRTFIFSSKNL